MGLAFNSNEEDSMSNITWNFILLNCTKMFESNRGQEGANLFKEQIAVQS